MMLYALMLNESTGVKTGATVLNLYPQRSPITVGWRQIESFQAPLKAFIEWVAAKEFPNVLAPPKDAPDPTEELADSGPDFKSEKLMKDGREKLRTVIDKLAEFGLQVSAYKGDEGPVIVGPSYTILRLVPGPKVKVAAISRTSGDLQVALACQHPPRIEQGPGYVSIEVPRYDRITIKLLDIDPKAGSPNPSSFIVGVDIFGQAIWGDFSKPEACHLLVGGQTGSGKSEFLRQLLCSLALSSTPDDLQLAVVDPKMTDYQDFNGSPYLMTPVVDHMEAAVRVLTRLVDEMQERYRLFKEAGVKNLTEYNASAGVEKRPRIILVFDEFADAMMEKELKQDLEISVKRLGGKARAAGIHLIIATQTPRKEVVTGLIKANLPCRIALQVANGMESGIILDEVGAEKLLGRGDLLAKWAGKFLRLQSPFADGDAVRSILFP